jgi:hypothetical protein
MIGRRAWIGIAVVLLGLGLAACSSGSPTTKASSGSTAPTPALKGGSDPNSTFCKNLSQENATESTLSTGLSNAMKSNNLATIKAAFNSFLVATQGELGKVTGAASSAPPNVKAAFKTVTDFYAQLKTTVAGDSSVAQIQSSLTSLTGAPAIRSAGTTISGYVTGLCGQASTATSTSTAATSTSST